MQFDTVNSMDELCALIENIGFLPYFANNIEGFSLEECIAPEYWFSETEGAWEWKGSVIQKTSCAYGKFFKNKAGFISRKFYPDFANYRRDGYDFDARYEDGLAKHADKEVFDILESNKTMLSYELKKAGGFGGKNGKKGFDGIITRLQMQGYIITENFEYRRDKNGNSYGWGVARYTTPEIFFGKRFTDKVYVREPDESLKKIVRHLRKKLDGVSEEDILKLIR